jgi:hypothetical protein
MISQKEIVPLAVLFGGIHLLLCIVQIAGEAWILTLFNDEDKAKASTYLNIGQNMGNLIGFQLFTPLNDLDWLNKNIFVNNPRDSPLVSHQMYCLFISAYFMGQILINELFVAEEKM